MKRLKRLFAPSYASITLLISALVVLFFLISVPFLDLMELKTIDLRFLSRGSIPSSGVVAMAMVDEKSLDAEGRWPWVRSKIAALIDTLTEDGAKVIAFDIGFLEPEENSGLQLIDQLNKQIEALQLNSKQLSQFLDVYRVKTDNDQILADAIKRTSAAIVLGHFFHMAREDLNYEITPAEIQHQLTRISASRYPLVSPADRNVEALPIIEAFAPEGNLEIFSQVADSSGFYNKTPDEDGSIRWTPLMIRSGDGIYASLAVQSAWYFLNRPLLVVKGAAHGVEGVQMGDAFIPTDEYGRMLINHLGPSSVIPQYSITDILKGRIKPGTFQDKIILVGGAAMGIADYIITPFSTSMPGLALHATVIDNILTRNFLNKPSWTRIFDLFAIIALGLVIGFVLPRINAFKGFLFALMLFSAYIFWARWLFVESGILLNMVYPLLGLVLTYIVLTVFSYFTEERERRRIKKTFSHYVASDVIEEMLEDPNRLKLGGEVKTLTVLFSDLSGFTRYSEKYRPEEMVNILNEYFTEMTDEVFSNHGTLKEYVGDELMAIFGAPVENFRHADQACDAALAMRNRLRALRLEWAELGRPQLTARTGVNSGSMLVGNLGSVHRFAYGVLGDQVNLGSRLEGLNKQYGTEILIGQNTASLVKDEFVLREIDSVRVVGKKEAVKVFELVSRSTDPVSREQSEFFDLYAEGLSVYRQRQWQKAQKLFQQASNMVGRDQSCLVMADRCRIYLDQPPPDDWGGVYQATKK